MSSEKTGPEFTHSAQYLNGTLRVSDAAANAMRVDGLDRQGPTNKPDAQPWVDFDVVGPGESEVPRGSQFSYQVEKGSPRNPVLKVRVGVGQPEVEGAASQVNGHLVARKLGATLAERLHKNRIAKVATVGAGAVLAVCMVKAGGVAEAMSEVATYAWTAVSYLAIRSLRKITSPRVTFSSRGSYEYAHSVVHNVSMSMQKKQ